MPSLFLRSTTGHPFRVLLLAMQDKIEDTVSSPGPASRSVGDDYEGGGDRCDSSASRQHLLWQSSLSWTRRTTRQMSFLTKVTHAEFQAFGLGFMSGCSERSSLDSSSVSGARFSFLPNLRYGMISRRGVSWKKDSVWCLLY